jgi:hypothetical protein
MLRAKGVAVAEIARRLGIDRRTVQDYLADGRWRTSRRSGGSQEELVEAGLAYMVCFGVAPSARNWNAALARRDGTMTFLRHRLGWVAEADAYEPQPRVHGWPSPALVARTFGSFPAFLRAVQRERARRERENRSYLPVPLPAEHVALVRTDAFCRDVGGAEWVRETLNTFGPAAAERRPHLDDLPPGVPPAIGTLNGSGVAMPPIAERSHLAIIGCHGTGRTSLLSSIAVADAADASCSLAVLERGQTIAGVLAHAGVELEGAPWAEMRRTRSAPPSAGWDGTPDTSARLDALALVAQLARNEPNPLSLIVDDADDVLEQVAEIAEGAASNLVVHAAWNPTGSEVDERLLDALPSLTVFRLDNWTAAEMASRRLNETYGR